MRRLVSVTLAVVAVLLATSVTVAVAQPLDAWLQDAQLGPYAPAEEDWDAVYAAALEEPPLRVYTSTSRVHAFIAAYEAQWPGLTAEAVETGSGSDAIERLTREWQAGLRNAGVIDLAGPESHAVLPEGSIVAYVPPEMRAVYPDRYLEPVLTVAVSLSGWAYNPDVVSDGPPFRSVWDLTTDDFRGLIVLTDPTISSSAGEQLVGTIARADELEADYVARFGEPLELRERDAGFEWFRRLLENDPIIVDGWRPAAEILTNRTEPIVAAMNFIRMVHVERGVYRMEFATGITPIDAISAPRWQAVGAFTPSPNAAKLFLRTMMTEEGGRPYFGEGFLSPRTDWAPTESWMAQITEINYWDPDPEFTQQHGFEVIDFWLLRAR